VSENLHLEILSVAELIARGRIRSLGQVIDEFDDLKPELAGPVDPPRTPVPSVERHLVDWQSTIRPGDYYTQLFARDVIPPMTYGMLQVTGDIWGFPPYAPHRFEYGVEEAWLDDEAHIERVADFFARAAEAFDAFWGAAGLTSFRRQANDFVLRAQVAGTLVLPGMPGTGWDLREHAVPDVFWLNYFGPSLLTHWGADRLQGLGVAQRATANGGRVIWSTESPAVFEPMATSLTDYAWKQPFYDALGRDTFLHEDWRDPGLGVNVPSYRAHRDLR
jgi:hypothetical protein